MSQSDSEIVLREVTPNVITFSSPFKVFGLIPVGGRSTAVRLSGERGVWVLASTPLTKETKAALDSLGPVRWIMAGDAKHYFFLGEYKSAYPDAQLVGVQRLVEPKNKTGLKFDNAYGVDPPGTKYGFEEEIEAIYFSGFAQKDVDSNQSRHVVEDSRSTNRRDWKITVRRVRGDLFPTPISKT